MPRLFLSQERLDSWIGDDKVQLVDDELKMQDGKTLKIASAVYVQSVIGDEEDIHTLVGRVKTEKQLKEMNAEHYMDSVILGETGYQVLQGFVGAPHKE